VWVINSSNQSTVMKKGRSLGTDSSRQQSRDEYSNALIYELGRLPDSLTSRWLHNSSNNRHRLRSNDEFITFNCDAVVMTVNVTGCAYTTVTWRRSVRLTCSAQCSQLLNTSVVSCTMGLGA